MTDPTYPTAHELAAALASGETTSAELVGRALDDIAERDGGIGAFLSVTPREDALALARGIDERRARGESLPRFAGVPVALKDNIAQAGRPMTAGSKMLANYVSPFDATATRRLEDAGLIVVGRTNMDEFGFGSSTEHSAFRRTNNPAATGRVPGGSSGGSAAAVAAGFVPWALGTDTGGSVRQPASFCGVVGARPTYGRVSRYGVVAFASSLDQIGPIARTTDDAAVLLGIISGHDERDATSLKTHLPDLLANDPGGGASGGASGKATPLRVGVPEQYVSGGCSPAIVGAVERAAGAFDALGWPVERVSLPMTDSALAAYYLISSVEAASNLSRYDGVRYGHRASGCASIDELITKSRTEGFGDEAKRRIVLGTFAASAGYADAYYLRACKARRLISEDFARVFESVQVLLSPVSPVAAWRFGERTNDPAQMYLADVFSVPQSLAALPCVAAPMGHDDEGVPVGVQFTAARGREDLAFAAARALEAGSLQA
jgi:aspartyl-tRNA(Asn)/glutamyl-tRNA(Gln) amidotransferase subunit A